MITVARNITHGQAYEKYSEQKHLAIFIGAENMITNTDLVFDTLDLEDVWQEFKEAGKDYVRKGKEVTNDTIALEISPTMNESENWTRKDWFDFIKELLQEIDNHEHSKARRDPKTKDWIRDENGNIVKFDVPKTHLSDSKWIAFLHRDSKSGIYHAHVTISRYTNTHELNCVTDIAHRAAEASERINERKGWVKAEDIRQQHIDEINGVLNDIFNDMDGDKIDWKELEKRITEASFIDYKGQPQNYQIWFHKNENGVVDGYTVGRGNSKFSAYDLGQKIKDIPEDIETEIKDNVYQVLRSMDGDSFSWDDFKTSLENRSYLAEDNTWQNYEVDLRSDSKGDIVGWSVIRDGKKYNASQIGAKLTAKKIQKEWEKEHQKVQNKPAETPVQRPERPSYNITAENAEKVVRQRLKELGITPVDVSFDKNNRFPLTEERYLRDVGKYLRLLDSSTSKNSREWYAEDALKSAVAASMIHARKQASQVEKNDVPVAPEKPYDPQEGVRIRQERYAVAKNTLTEYAHSNKNIFSEDQEDKLMRGIMAKCIEDAKPVFNEVNLIGTAQELAVEVGERVEHTSLRLTQLVGETLMHMALPEDRSLGGPGSNNDLSRKKDDEMNRSDATYRQMRLKSKGRKNN